MREGSKQVRRLGFAAGLLLAASAPGWAQTSPACGTPTALDDGWTIVTEDGSLAAHWEHTVAILDDGPWVLTASDGGRAQLAARGVSLSQRAA